MPVAQTRALIPSLSQGQGHDGPPPLSPGPGTLSAGSPSMSDLPNLAPLASVSPPAANYSMPVVSAPTAAPQDEELTFTCTSTDGYPRPNVYWINRTDNSLLDEGLQNSTVSLNARGLYDVVSVLTIRRTPHVNVGCCIENVLLHQNLTVSSQKASGKDPQACPCHGLGPGSWEILSEDEAPPRRPTAASEGEVVGRERRGESGAR